MRAWRRAFAVEARAERPDLALLCLLIATEADPALDGAGMAAARRQLDLLARLLPPSPGGPRAWAAALAELLGGRFGFGGRPGDYQRLESALLHRVLRRRSGLPILLSVLWIEVARRAGAPVYGVALPGHFVVAFGSPDACPGEGCGAYDSCGGQGGCEERVLADPFGGGRLLSCTEVRLLVAGATGAPPEPAMLRPADPREIVLRVLNNIRAWAAARPERSDVALWAVELALLLPGPADGLHHDRAQLLVQRGDFRTGAAELETYADALAPRDAAAAERVRRQARAARARLN
ncbi:transglutaminase-like domain-containing protein [Streptomyces sp. AN091965]|uniref:transglutaminase family protein n=1 Tax=Streptomyces sp. AN091965 TaxID=2927803 RepID=UPI001F619DAB|nr:transglutaminase-like domain-containing protein [Streptomyces sp. AN091965]MCI3932871.1 transglutaminase-like domain-containing protein [Streptomyces sp. AN091965]